MNTCRVCLQTGAETYCSLFKNIRNVTLGEMYHTLTGISVSLEDDLPNCVCQDCADFIVTCNNFRNKCLKSDAELRADVSSKDALLRVEGFESPEADSKPLTRINIYFEESECIVPDKLDCSDEIELNGEHPTIHTEHVATEWTNYDETVYELYDVTEEEDTVKREHTTESENGESCEIVLESEEILEHSQTSVEEIETQPALTDDSAIPSILRCCGCPSLQFDTNEDLLQHSAAVHRKNRTPSSLRPHECNICYRRYSKRFHLLKHKATMNQPIKVYNCKSCDASFKCRTSLHSHNKSKHVRMRSYVCDVCQKGFYTSSTLVSHRMVHREKRFQCKECSKMFARLSDLVTHQTSHSDNRPYGCAQCKMRFKTLPHLRSHQTVHTGERSKKCRICGKGFTTYSDRRVHELEHDNIHPFKCEFCDKNYRRNNKLQVHIRKEHTGERPHPCSECPKRFIQRWELSAHRRKEHGYVGGVRKHETIE